MAAEPPPVTARHLEAAQYLYDHLPEWNQSDAAFIALRDAHPGFSLRDTFLKVAAVVGLYGIQRLHVPAMAVQLANRLNGGETYDVTPEFVENDIAPLQTGKRKVRYRSFASKFAHFFLPSANGDCVPIYDQHSVRLVALHSGRTLARTGRDYIAFADAHTEVRKRNGLTCTNKKLDQYLWIAGVLGKARLSPPPLAYQELRQLLDRDATAREWRDTILGD